MESEKVKEIKKALECNVDYEHHDKLSYIDGYKCKLVAYADILTLINELESELEKEQINNLNCDTELQYKEKRIANLEKIGLNENITVAEYLREMQRLKDKVADLEKEIEENAFYSKGYAQGIKNTYEVVVPDKLKQFAERLKEILEENSPIAGYDLEDLEFDGETIQECIDETLKEFIK